MNYGEAQSAESRKDFIHKMKIILKELRETMIYLKLIKNRDLMRETVTIDKALIENNELIAIFAKAFKRQEKIC